MSSNRLAEGRRRLQVDLPRELVRAIRIQAAATDGKPCEIVEAALRRYFAGAGHLLTDARSAAARAEEPVVDVEVTGARKAARAATRPSRVMLAARRR